MRTLFFGLSFFSLTASLAICNEPYDSFKTIAYEPYFIQDGYILLDKINTQGTTIFIDVGSEIASRFVAANTNETVRVFTISTWENDDYDFQKFISNVKQENQNEKITPIRMSARGASTALNLVSEFIFLEASDPEVVYENILSWVSHLSDNGMIGGNEWERPSVELAVVQAAADLNLALSTNGTYWFLKKD